MKRRDLLVALGAGTIAVPLASLAQQPSKVFRIGFLSAESAARYANRLEIVLGGLRGLGYAEGKNIAVEFRWADGDYDRLPKLAAELARLNVDVIVAGGTKATLAARHATTTIPIVMAPSGDAVAFGLISSLAQPGGNITGWTLFTPELNEKRLALLKEAVPRIARVAFLMNPANSSSPMELRALKSTAKTLKVDLQEYEAQTLQGLDSAFAGMVKQGVDAVIVQGETLFSTNARKISTLATKFRLPMVANGNYSDDGCLIGYGPDLLEPYRRAPVFVDKILKGAKPADIPVERATKFELIVNLKTAKSFGIKVPQNLLLRADKVIE